MPDTPVAHTEVLANTEYDAGHRASVEADSAAAPPKRLTNEPLPVSGDEPDVGLAQKGTDEEAVIRRETEI